LQQKHDPIVYQISKCLIEKKTIITRHRIQSFVCKCIDCL